MTRTFEIKSAVREKNPLMLGFLGSSGSGKTYSALRVATGIQSVVGGDIHVIDTEARRALLYAPKPGEKAQPAGGTFTFKHLPFGAPFGPLDYLAAIEHCAKNGAKTIIVDSMSFEHEGPGGVLEMHEAELQRIAGNDYKKRERVQMLCWQKPKSQRRKLINAMLQMDISFLLCFRAKPKIKMVKGQEPLDLGWQPIGSPEFMYEMFIRFLFMPGCNGVPAVHSDLESEKEIIRTPKAWREYFAQPRQLTEETGAALAAWSSGDAVAKADITVASLVQSYAACSDAATFRALENDRKAIWSKANATEKNELKLSSERAVRRMEEAERAPVTPEVESDGGPPADWEPTREPGSDDE